MHNLILDKWEQLYLTQLDWAFRAHKKLLTTLSSDIQEIFESKDNKIEPYVAVFGKTQVGKTTLILDLMGVCPEEMPRISSTLRGGREVGKSSTPTAMEYRKSENNQWGLSSELHTTWFDNEDDLSIELGSLRKKMESGLLINNKSFIVHIPKNLFIDVNSNISSIRILDLPGDQPSNEQEQKHVYDMAKTYLPFADLILLVGRGDDLSFLRRDHIALPKIEDWQAMPHKFRIITTYSYSAQSIRELFRNNKTFDIKEIRSRLINQIECFDSLSEEAKEPTLYFPLEFGNSWSSTKEKEPKLYEKLSPLINNLKKNLLDQIYSSTTQMGRIINMLNMNVSIKNIKKRKIDNITYNNDYLNDIKNKNLSDIRVIESAIRETNLELKNLKLMMKKIYFKESSKLVKKAINEIEYPNNYPPNENDIKNNCETLRRMIREYYDFLKKIKIDIDFNKNDKYWKQISRVFVKPNFQTINDIIEQEFYSINARLNNYIFDMYFIDDNYLEDKNLVHKAGVDAEEKIKLLWKNQWFKAIDFVENKVKNEYENKKNILGHWDKDVEDIKKNLQVIDKKISNNFDKLRDTELIYNDDLKRCANFDIFLNEEYLTELNLRFDSIATEDDDCDALIKLFACLELQNKKTELVSSRYLIKGE